MNQLDIMHDERPTPSDSLVDKSASDRLERVLKRISGWLVFPAALALLLMMLQVTADVAARTLLGRPLPLTIEVVSYYYMIAVVFLPLAAVEMARHHIAVNLISNLLKSRWRLLVQGFGVLVATIYYVLLAWKTGEDAWDKFEVGEYLMGTYALPTWPGRFLLPIGAGLFAIAMVVRVIQVMKGRDLDEPDATGAQTEEHDV